MNKAAHLPIGRMVPGTDESFWQRVLAGAPLWSPADGPLLIVSPHPHDAVLAAGGLVHTWGQRERRVTILSLTDGEAAPLQSKRFGQVRPEELKEALRILSANPVLTVRLGIPDGRMADHLHRLRGAIISLLAPDTTLIAPCEGDGCPDNEAAGRVCREMAREFSLPAVRYSHWARHHATPASWTGAVWKRFPLSETSLAAKAAAVNCFASQTAACRRAPLTRPYEAFLM